MATLYRRCCNFQHWTASIWQFCLHYRCICMLVCSESTALIYFASPTRCQRLNPGPLYGAFVAQTGGPGLPAVAPAGCNGSTTTDFGWIAALDGQNGCVFVYIGVCACLCRLVGLCSISFLLLPAGWLVCAAFIRCVYMSVQVCAYSFTTVSCSQTMSPRPTPPSACFNGVQVRACVCACVCVCVCARAHFLYAWFALTI
jgi:hypothetical protein